MSHALIVGASRGIGAEFVRQCLADGWQVTATARSEEALAHLRRQGARAIALDVASAASASHLACQIDGTAFDLVLLNAGVYGPRTQGMQPPSVADFDAVMHTNVFGAMCVLPQIAEALAPGATLAVVSSRMGSIGQRAGGSGWLYRASKAALNSVLKDASLALAGKAVCVSFHPGWVRTDMGGAGADLDVADSVRNMRRTLAGLTAADKGRFLNHDGTPIDW
ncbi:SDR family oxidoreductase [uncultured Piscinibacter sp.]|uniref:SDR family oxidoreductase n=1 Tax=uncultured Piscinibacter sp. TaxID=1131835 RepID=UPI00262F571A|nr:SDR family oxidoreductase [uncultured Piscinibacter sp.]